MALRAVWAMVGAVEHALTIIVVEQDRDRALLIVDALREAGPHRIAVISSGTGLARRVAEARPDLVLIDAGAPSRDALEELTLAAGTLERPVAMFVARSDQSLTRAAIEAGVSAYVVGGLRAERIRPVLDAAIARFHRFARMRTLLAATKAALDYSKRIDRAKGIGKDEGYGVLRRTDMDRGRKLAEIAAARVTASELLK